MRKLRTSGSVGGRAGNRSVYPTRQQLWPAKRENTYGFAVEQRSQADRRGAILMPGSLGRLSYSLNVPYLSNVK